MPRRIINVDTLSVEIQEVGDRRTRKLTAIIEFTEGMDSWQVTIPMVIADQLRVLLDQFQLSVVDEDAIGEPVRNAVAEKNYTVVLKS